MKAPARLRPAAGLAGRALALAWALASLGCNSGTGSTTESGLVKGRILSDRDKAPVPGAVVSLVPVDNVPSPVLRKSRGSGAQGGSGARDGRGAGAAALEAVTDQDGNYAFKDVPEGIYNVIAGKDTLKAFRDSLPVGADGADAGGDTLRTAGSLAGRVELRPGDDRRTVLILFLGTNTLAVPRDTSGSFQVAGLAQGEYRVRFLSTISEYAPLDTILRIRSGAADTLPSPVRLAHTGIPTVEGVTASWDTVMQRLTLRWSPARGAAGYNVYRASQGASLGSTPLNPALIEDTLFVDTAARSGNAYTYAVKAVDADGNPGDAFSVPVSVAAGENYRFAGSFLPAGTSLDNTPLAVGGGEIFWVDRLQVFVYDTAGVQLRTFGGSGPRALRSPRSIRLVRDTVMVLDRLEDHLDKVPFPVIRRYTRQGAYIDSIPLAGAIVKDVGAAGEAWWAEDGSAFYTDGFDLAVFPPGAAGRLMDPMPTPPLIGPNLKLEPYGDRLLLMGGTIEVGTRKTDTRYLILDRNLSVAKSDSLDFWFNAFTVDPAGSAWVVRDQAWVEKLDSAFRPTLRVAVPARNYRDLAVDGDGTLYLYDYDGKSILRYRPVRP